MNQYNSRKTMLLGILATAHDWLTLGNLKEARHWLDEWRLHYEEVPASTKRRWKCGR